MLPVASLLFKLLTKRIKQFNKTNELNCEVHLFRRNKWTKSQVFGKTIHVLAFIIG